MVDMSEFVAPKSDQLNADDLIAGPLTIRVTRVAGTGNHDQPVAVYFDGVGGKPYKPCKSMRRVMIAAWGVDAAQYVGRSMTLYRDPKVKFGGMEVGGIRISHMSHIDHDLTMALTVTKARREPYRVRVLTADAAPSPDQEPPPAARAQPAAATDAVAKVRGYIAQIEAFADMDQVHEWVGSETRQRMMDWLRAHELALAKEVEAAEAAAFKRLEAAP